MNPRSCSTASPDLRRSSERLQGGSRCRESLARDRFPSVETQAKTEIAQALRRETGANKALNSANQELSRSRSAVQARYELAVDAVKTFHTGVSEDFLLKEEKFKDLRDRLLKSASDFYGKLSALLGKETDSASRRALAAANFELAGLTAKVGHNSDALAAHRSVLAARRELAAQPGAGAAAQAAPGTGQGQPRRHAISQRPGVNP